MRFHKTAQTLSVFALVLSAGCALTRDEGSPAAIHSGIFDESAAQRDLQDARRVLNDGKSYQSIPRFLHVIAQYPDTRAAIEARYFLGLTYWDAGSYRDAIEMLQDYVRLAPEGDYAEASREAIGELAAEYESRYMTAEKLDAHIQALKQQYEAQPSALSVQLELADLLWQRGNYEEAGRLYMSIVSERPGYARNETVASRIDILGEDEYIVLTPREVMRRRIAEEPVTVVNTAAFGAGRGVLFTEHPYYVVTGQVVNRGDSVLYGVQVYVTLYGFGRMVLDTRTVNVGRLNPGEIRAFSVRFSNFESPESIERYQTEVTFQR